MIKPTLFRILYDLRMLKLFKQFHFHYYIREFVKPGDVVIDIGAGWGCYTRIFSGLGARVFAVEPLTTNQSTEKIIWLPFALGDKDDAGFLTHWRNTSGAYKLSDTGNIAVEIKRGSKLFEYFSKINFIKIDVEESELPIIKDMKELIEKHKPMILIETGFLREVLNLLPDYNILHSFQNEYLLCCPKK